MDNQTEQICENKSLKNSKNSEHTTDNTIENNNKHLVEFKNGTYDLHNKTFTNKENENALIKYDYDIYDKNHPDVIYVENFFKQIQPEDDMRLFLLCYTASLLKGGNYDQKFMLLYGDDNASREMYVDLLKQTFDKYFGNASTSLIMKKSKNDNEDNNEDNCEQDDDKQDCIQTCELSNKQNTRILMIQQTETNNDTNIDICRMKELSGLDSILARKLYSKPFYFVPQFKLMMCCSKLPDINEIDNGTWRRMSVIKFESKLTNNENKEKLLSVKGAFMWLLINVYYPIYDEKGLKNLIPDKVSKTLEEYKKTIEEHKKMSEEHKKMLKLTELKEFEEFKENKKEFEEFKEYKKMLKI